MRRSPLCAVRHVRLTVFRALYQFGEPLYPPSHISFQAGPTPWALAPATLKFPVAATSACPHACCVCTHRPGSALV